ncbi:AraC family transcriptional regulator [Deinococcus alpinitundrae]|uniref:AraC family transcriptional regulator n=1 Tax=Deinococcus alpinitundrae TaxID=468913 RepID=UPI001379BEF6|nr:AraC family transcriptional regulator [Deinococcus alpinitundrae]
MDPLSDVLSRMRPSSPLARLATDHGNWCVQFQPHGYIKCYAVLSGTCWIAVEDGEPVALMAGDCVLLPGQRGFRLGSDLTLPAVPQEVYLQQKTSRVLDARKGDMADADANEVTFIGSAFTLPGPQAALLLEALPPLIHLEQVTGEESLRWSLERMEQELREEQPGARLMAEHLAQVFLIQALRIHLDRVGTGQVGWLFALTDPQLSGVLGAMHTAPAYPWTVQGLAERAGLPRSTFAALFSAGVGLTPLAYLTRWRMLLAADRLIGGEESVADIALSVGYESEAAFSTAFKRVMGRPPRRYGRQGHQAAAD